MKCAACSAEIAEKAIVCYRCGAPTAIPSAARDPAQRRAPSRPPWAALLVLLAVTAAAAVVAFRMPADSSERLLAGFVAALTAIVAVSIVLGRLRRR